MLKVSKNDNLYLLFAKRYHCIVETIVHLTATATINLCYCTEQNVALENVQTAINKVNAIHNSCLQKICNIYWPNKISIYNDDLYLITKCTNIDLEVKKHRLGWLGRENQGCTRVEADRQNETRETENSLD